jgi:Lysozyme like domain
LIIEAFPEDSRAALAIAKCESGLNPKAFNPHNNDGTTDGGLWQINTVHDHKLQKLGLDKFDPHDATEYARMLYEQNGWRDWVCARKLALL